MKRRTYAPSPANLALLLLAFSWWALMMGCSTHWRDTYLDEARGAATQQDIERELGAPHITQLPTDGTTIWIYEYLEPFYLVNVKTTTCTRYLLIFDRQRVLKSWHRQKCANVPKEGKGR